MSQAEKERSQEQREASETGSGNEQVQQFGVVFYVTVAISAAFVLAGVFFTDPFSSALATVVGYITDYLGWLYMLMTAFFLAFAVWLALSRYGKIRLGQLDDRPEFGHFAWFAMLFQAGMGIGLVFWAVSEPLTHYVDPPLGLAKPETANAASLALQTAFFHWCLHPWAIYAVVGLAVAYFSYRRGMTNLQISTVFRPLLGDRVDGPIGKAIDIISIIATLFGVAVSLGLGTLQIDAGLGKAFGLPRVDLSGLDLLRRGRGDHRAGQHVGGRRPRPEEGDQTDLGDHNGCDRGDPAPGRGTRRVAERGDTGRDAVRDTYVPDVLVPVQDTPEGLPRREGTGPGDHGPRSERRETADAGDHAPPRVRRTHWPYIVELEQVATDTAIQKASPVTVHRSPGGEALGTSG